VHFSSMGVAREGRPSVFSKHGAAILEPLDKEHLHRVAKLQRPISSGARPVPECALGLGSIVGLTRMTSASLVFILATSRGRLLSD
jgi:hypothetical protein